VCKEFLEGREYIRLPEMGKVAGDAMKNVVKSELGVEFPLERHGKVGHGGGMSSRSVHSPIVITGQCLRGIIQRKAMINQQHGV